MEQLQATDSEDKLKYGEQAVEGEVDCVWASVPETAETGDENGVVEEEEYIGLPSGGGTDQEEKEEEMYEEEMMDEEHQIMCEGSQSDICSLPWLMKNIVFVQGWCHDLFKYRL